MHRAVGVEREPLTATQSIRSRAMIILMAATFGWDVVSTMLGLNTSATAGHVACKLKFLRWPASLMVPSRYSAFVADHCASGDLAGVVPVLALLAKFSLAILVVLAIWASLWPERHTPRSVISRAERKALQGKVVKPLTDVGFALRRVMFSCIITGMITGGYVVLFKQLPSQTSESFIMLMFASTGFTFSAMAFSALSVWVALLFKAST